MTTFMLYSVILQSHNKERYVCYKDIKKKKMYCFPDRRLCIYIYILSVMLVMPVGDVTFVGYVIREKNLEIE